MSDLLVLSGSPRGAASESDRLVAAAVQGFREEAIATGAHPDVDIDTWNLWADPPPWFGPDEVLTKMTLMQGSEPSDASAESWARIEAAARRVRSASAYILGVPMWNGGVPWLVKQWIDVVTQPGLLFTFDPDTGYSGLLRDKRALVVLTSSVYAPGVPASFGTDHHGTYLGDWLTHVGVGDVRTVRLQPSHPGSSRAEERRAAALARARAAGRLLRRPDGGRRVA